MRISDWSSDVCSSDLMLAHQTEIPESGDYVVRDMGEDQVIVGRTSDGAIHVSLNICPHRGMRLCMGDAGNAAVHRCIYHGWAFRPAGSRSEEHTSELQSLMRI